MPIIRSQSNALLQKLINENQPKNILEIGTFIGYSASVMLSSCDGKIVTVEIDPNNAKKAAENLTAQGFAGRFDVLNMDAWDFLQENKEKKFDFIFLDGPKGQYLKYLPILKEMLCKGGILVCDDVLFHGLVKKEGLVAHKHRTIVVNLRKFLQILFDDKDFDSQLFEFEDGVTVSRKK